MTIDERLREAVDACQFITDELSDPWPVELSNVETLKRKPAARNLAVVDNHQYEIICTGYRIWIEERHENQQKTQRQTKHLGDLERKITRVEQERDAALAKLEAVTKGCNRPPRSNSEQPR
jgi:hypothetical protein